MAYADVARGVLRYVLRDMTDAAGGFYSAEDADSLPFEGAAEKKEVRGDRRCRVCAWLLMTTAELRRYILVNCVHCSGWLSWLI